MSRKPRPLIRDTESCRDDRLFIVACDDTYAPKQYFGFFKLPRIQVHVVPTPPDSNTCHAIDVLGRLKEVDHNDYDERWLLLDTDHYTQGAHLQGFTLALKQAREAGINVALSKPCFEFWLLLHHVEGIAVAELPDAKAAEAKLRATLGGRYNKKRLQAYDFPLASVQQACLQAEQLDLLHPQVIPSGNTSRVYQLWRAIVGCALPSQLPKELQALHSVI